MTKNNLSLCFWTYDSLTTTWKTQCGESFTFYNTNLKDSGFYYCFGCGKLISPEWKRETRPLKFRMWDGKQFTYWGFGIKPGTFAFPSAMSRNEMMSAIHLQFTGLLDKNGREIYEGDVLRSLDGWLFEVIFDHGRFCIRGGQPWGIRTDLGFNHYPHAFTVVDNMYENPGLFSAKVKATYDGTNIQVRVEK